MKRKWRYLIGAFLLAAGLFVGCAEKSGQPPEKIQAESQELEQAEASAVEAEFSEAGEEGAEALETPEAIEDEEASETPEATEAPEVSEIPEAIETLEASEAIEASKASETPEAIAASEAPEVIAETELLEDGTYTSKEEVAEYIFIYGHLPDNFITKKEAKALGWVSSKGNLGEVAPGKSIGGDYFGNFEGNLPEKKGREYHECDIDSSGGYRGAKRIVYSNDGLIYYTEDHYNTFELLYGEE